MAKKMKGDFDRLGRWEQTDDILQNASMRLFEALNAVTLADERHFFRLAALQIAMSLSCVAKRVDSPDQHAQLAGRLDGSVL